MSCEYMIRHTFLELLRYYADKPYVYFCPKCGYKCFKSFGDLYACSYCDLEYGYTGKAENYGKWKKQSIETLRKGKLRMADVCEDKRCKTCYAQDKSMIM